jgi:hypothetical protein
MALQSGALGTTALPPVSIASYGGLMVIRWGVFSAKSRTALKTGWLITAGVAAFYLGLIQPRDQARGIASEKATGLAAVSGGVGWEPILLWRQTSILPHLRSEAYLQKGIVGGVPVDRAVVAPASLMTFSGGRAGGEENSPEDRRLVRTGVPWHHRQNPSRNCREDHTDRARCRRIPRNLKC